MSNAYGELIERQREEVNTLPTKWAFSHKQFEEIMAEWGLTPGDDNHKLLSIGMGGYILKSDRNLIVSTFKRHREELDAAIAADETGEGFILDMFRYELANHEYCITCDYEDTLDAVGLTEEDLQQQPKLYKALHRACKEIIREWEESE